ncbi:uncharacterized protein LOC131315828 [Rhododendron vialii]|uniref:uncharacterized protein LOC131315828 n=1 Tax=Rhododendron vialii TaxID=182163 RepID=UPI00265F4EAB|nr:uncharacterized protein LOC131315828 [Rhododendron vialii]
MDNEGVVDSADLGCQQSLENSSGLDDVHNACDTVVVLIRSEVEQQDGLDPNGDSNEAVSVLVGCTSKEGGGKKQDCKDGNESSCVIDVDERCGESCEGERVCRICHLSPQFFETATETTTSGLIQLGCGCKDELGIVHVYCAEAWFKLRGNRQCEICGETAKNVKGGGDNRLTEECNEMRSAVSATNFSARSGVYLRGQPFCNFLLACLVIAFVLPWFFRVNVF